MSQFPTFVAAHRAEVRGPPVGRGPQVENRCTKPMTHNSLLASKVRHRRGMQLGIKKVLSCFLNSPVSRVDLMSPGSVFQAYGSATSKVLSDSEETSFVLGTSSSCQ